MLYFVCWLMTALAAEQSIRRGDTVVVGFCLGFTTCALLNEAHRKFVKSRAKGTS